MRARRTASLATLVVLTGALASSSGPASGADIRTDTTLGGYSIKTSAAPLKVLLDDPASAIPHEPGSAIVEADPSYTAATLETGPASRALASSLWPGTLLGDGIGAATNGALPGYPVKADARYPDKPYTATAHGCLQADQPATCADDNGALMQSQALGLDVRARARLNPSDVPGTLEVGLASSVSTATVKDGVAIGTADSQLSDVSLLAGIIKVGSVNTSLTVKGDGKKAASSGSTVVSGLTIGGVGYVVDEKGARPVGTPVNQGTGVLPTNALDPAKAAGITISGIAQDHTQDATSVKREAQGLRITIDTVVLRGALNQVPSAVTDALVTVFSQAPAQLQGYLFYLLTTTPKITFVLGAGTGSAAATLPLSFSFPDLPLPAAFPPVSPGGTSVTPTLPGTVSAGGTGLPTAPGPVIVPPTAPKLVAAAKKDPFGGLPPGLLLLVAALAGLGGWGLVRLQSAAFVGAAGAGPCNDGTAPTLPDLRGA